MVELTGETVTLRPFTAADITDAYLGWLRDPVVMRFSNQRFTAHTKESCSAYLRSFEGTPNLFLSLRRRDDDRPIGTMTVYMFVHHGTADVGILVGDRSVWGQGYGQDAWNTVLQWLLLERGVRKVTAGTLEINHGMRRLAERSGMALEGRRLRQEIVEGVAVDVLYFGRFAS